MSADKQTRKVYQAENEVFEDEKHITKSKGMLFFAAVVSSKWFRKKYPNANITLEFKEKKCRPIESEAYKNHIVIHLEQNQKSTYLHEIAHAVVSSQYNKNPHSGAFCRRYIELVEVFVGQEKAQELASKFIKKGVKF